MLVVVLRLHMRRGLIPAEQLPAFKELLDNLRGVWQPLIKPVQELQRERLGLQDDDLLWGSAPQPTIMFEETDRLQAGEIYRVDEGLVVITAGKDKSGGRIIFGDDGERGMVPMGDGDEGQLRLEVSALVHGNSEALLDKVAEAAKKLLGIDLSIYRYKNSRFDSLRKEVVAEELPSEETHIAAAGALVSRVARTMAVAVKSSRGILARDAERQVPNDIDAQPIWDDLVQKGVLLREVVIVCNTTKEQTARVTNEGSLTELARLGLRCACGRPIDEEQPDYLYTVTDIGRLLLDKSRWMSILVRHELVQLGVPDKDILLECQIGSDEIDCIALISGEVTIFELKDKDFSMGNAYSFGAKMSILNSEHAVVVTTESVSPDVKSHFDRTRATGRRPVYLASNDPQAIHYVEGAEFLAGLAPIVGGIYSKDGEKILDKALALCVTKSESLVKAI
jgi:hypothetical protein